MCGPARDRSAPVSCTHLHRWACLPLTVGFVYFSCRWFRSVMRARASSERVLAVLESLSRVQCESWVHRFAIVCFYHCESVI